MNWFLKEFAASHRFDGNARESVRQTWFLNRVSRYIGGVTLAGEDWLR
jgi:hypothetical protein